MRRCGLVFLALIICLGLTVSGCSSAQKKLSEEVKGVKTKVDTLEVRVEGVEAKQTENERLAMEQAQKLEEMKAERGVRSGRSNVEIKEKRSRKDKDGIREIQACLKNAGFYHGEIDGVKGRQTRTAIKKFQSANGLTVDGIVGKRTREALSKYSSGTGIAAPAAAEEEATAK
jgi:murein L,D-transpeptidase YcbB/YkuD